MLIAECGMLLSAHGRQLSAYCNMHNPTPEYEPDLTKLLPKLADAVNQRRMQIPAIFFLEMYKPLTTMLHAAGVMSVPFLWPLFGPRWCAAALKMLESRDHIERLICLIEEQQNGC